jgi:chorismate synthase
MSAAQAQESPTQDGDDEDDEDEIQNPEVPIQTEEVYVGAIQAYSPALTTIGAKVHVYFRGAPRGWYEGTVLERLEDAYGHKVMCNVWSEKYHTMCKIVSPSQNELK